MVGGNLHLHNKRSLSKLTKQPIHDTTNNPNNLDKYTLTKVTNVLLSGSLTATFLNLFSFGSLKGILCHFEHISLYGSLTERPEDA